MLQKMMNSALQKVSNFLSTNASASTEPNASVFAELVNTSTRHIDAGTQADENRFDNEDDEDEWTTVSEVIRLSKSRL